MATNEVTVGPGEIRRQVNQFLHGTTNPASANLQSLSSSALFLLSNVPVARHAVLKHYSSTFDEAINAFLSEHPLHTGLDTENSQLNQLSALQDVTRQLLNFIKSNAEAWAPVVSSWALTLLGEMSSKYAVRRGVQHAASINEILQMWMACPPAKMLIEITTECFAAMVGAAPDMCVDALLEASVRYSPHFDWVVAHIGSCFPRTIITRVLNCGLKDFCSSGIEGLDEKDLTASRIKIPKMASVVGILEHLAANHSPDIRKALMNLFEASLQSESVSSGVTTLPFLLQLAYMSNMLLHILTTDLVTALKTPVLNQLHRQFTHWKRSSPPDYTRFLNLVVHLIGKCKTGSFDIVSFVLQTAVPEGGAQQEQEQLVEEVRDTCVEIMHILLFELQRGVLSRKNEPVVVEIPLLTGLASQTDQLIRMLLHSDGHSDRVPWLQKLLTLSAIQAGEMCAASILSSIIFLAEKPSQLGAFFRLKQGIELGIPHIVQAALDHVFDRLEASSSPTHPSLEISPSPTKPSLPSLEASSSPAHPGLDVSSSSTRPSMTAESTTTSNLLPVLQNLERVANVELMKIQKGVITCSTIMEGLQKQNSTLCEFLLSSDLEVGICVLRLMDMVGFPASMSTAQTTHICGIIALTFLTSLHLRALHKDGGKKLNKMTQLCTSCIEQLSVLPFARSLLIHYLVEGAVQQEHCYLFGGKWSQIPFLTSSWSGTTTSSMSSNLPDTISLLEENRQQALSIALPRFHSSVYHGGVIRQTARSVNSGRTLSKENVTANNQTFVEVLWLCGREMKSVPPKQPSAGDSGKQSGEPMDVDQSALPPCLTTYSISESSARTLGCVIVNILTLDSLYNDVHWQDPDFRKVTIERDTLVWKRLQVLPVLWDLIQEFSSSCVFLYYLSPVLRAVMAVIMNHMEVSRESRMKNCPIHYESAVKLVYCLSQGSLIPPPLSNVAELFPFVSPYEGYLLLLTLWRYIKDNPPSEFEQEVKGRTCDSSHMFVVNSIIHANIDHMGQLCPRIFNM